VTAPARPSGPAMFGVELLWVSMMSSDHPPRTFIPAFKGTAGLLVAVAVVAVLLVSFPAYRLFFAVSVGIGVVVAGVLFLWHKLRPLKEEDIENKRPLGLD
jgi:hypothetical protein